MVLLEANRTGKRYGLMFPLPLPAEREDTVCASVSARAEVRLGESVVYARALFSCSWGEVEKQSMLEESNLEREFKRE
jgi:hypothetical protein